MCNYSEKARARITYLDNNIHMRRAQLLHSFGKNVACQDEEVV